jgi:hypothetical protein
MAEKEEIMPNIGLLTTLWISETLYGEKTQVSWIDGEDGIPALEGEPEQITKTVLDMDTQISRPGAKSIDTVSVPILYTHTQHKTLKAKERKDLYFFEKYPTETAEDGENPLVKYFRGSYVLIDDAKTAGDFIRDNMVLYRTSEITESDGFPKEA